MTNKAILLVTQILQNRDLLECTGIGKFVEDEDGHVEVIHVAGVKIRRYEKPDQKYGLIFKVEFSEGTKPRFVVQDYLRNKVSDIVFAKKDEKQEKKRMDQIVYRLEEVVNNTINSINNSAKFLAGIQ